MRPYFSIFNRKIQRIERITPRLGELDSMGKRSGPVAALVMCCIDIHRA
jgi:hypothetical protein